jgi:hypothetical protein
MPTSVQFTESELDRALAFIVDHGYSYYFPTPFELEALLDSWDKIRGPAASVDLANYQAKPYVQLFAPKNKYTFRPIWLLDPVDLLYLTALALRFLPSLKAITNSDNPVTYSFRVREESDASVHLDSDYRSWALAIEERLPKYKMVAKADIVDFFPRINHHSLVNSLQDLAPDMATEINALMESFLKVWTGRKSYGIPIGPTACTIFSEALLREVDDYLLSEGLDFVRYVDDYRFFGANEADCLKALFLLAKRLHETEGLSLNMAKTTICSTSQILSELKPPEDPNSALQTQVIEEIFGGDPYAVIDPDKMTAHQKKLLDQLAPSRMLQLALEESVIDLRAVKFVLNVLAGLKEPKHLDSVIENLDRLQPVSDTVARFLSLAEFPSDHDRIEVGARLLDYLETPGVTEYQTVWLLQPFAASARWDHPTLLRRIARNATHPLVRRQAALAIGHARDRSALLDLKTRLNSADVWEYRAIILACRGLPSVEKDVFWRNLRLGRAWTMENCVAKATLDYAKKIDF